MPNGKPIEDNLPGIPGNVPDLTVAVVSALGRPSR